MSVALRSLALLLRTACSDHRRLAIAFASHDAQLRQAAFDHVDRLATLRGGVLDSADLTGGFEIWRSAHSSDQPAARDLQAAADVAPVEHKDRVPETGRSGLV